MFTLKYAAILAVIGSAFATPVAHHHRDNNQVDRPEVGRASGSEQGYNGGGFVVVVTNGGKNPNPPSGYKPVSNNGGTNTGSKPTTSAAAAAPAATTPASTNTGTNTGTSSGGSGYLAIANKWRVANGKAAWVQDSKLESNVLNCLQSAPGQMVHKLNSGSFGQVLAPGNAGNFESVYVGGWLCEVPSLMGLNGICSSMTKGWDHSDGETGHADILSSSKYTKIGCQLFDGIWGCDVA